MSQDSNELLESKLFRITPSQQMVAACSGALLTSLIGKFHETITDLILCKFC